MSTLNIKGTVVLEKNLAAFNDPKIRIIVNQGGSRSSKTYSLIQTCLQALYQCSNEILTITRKTMPSLKTSAMRDFFDILKSHDIYDETKHNRSDHIYKLHGNIVEFIGLDQPQKKRGAKRKYLWMNETNEFTYEDFLQYSMRTTGKIFMDYNPSDSFHWLYDKILTREDAIEIRSTYKDNPFLEQSLIKEIEGLKDIDPDYWRIYGEGERGGAKTLIFTNWDLVSDFPEDVNEIIYGIDFGFTHPSAIIKFGVKGENDAFIHEELYETRLTNADLIERLKVIIPPSLRNKCLIKADNAEPDRILEIEQAGFWIEPCRKGPGSVMHSIDIAKRFNMHITRDSSNVQAEIKGYKFRIDRNGNVMDEPVKFKDDAMACVRYVLGDMDEYVHVDILDGATQGTDRTETVPVSRVHDHDDSGIGSIDGRGTSEMDWN